MKLQGKTTVANMAEPLRDSSFEVSEGFARAHLRVRCLLCLSWTEPSSLKYKI